MYVQYCNSAVLLKHIPLSYLVFSVLTVIISYGSKYFPVEPENEDP